MENDTNSEVAANSPSSATPSAPFVWAVDPMKKTDRRKRSVPPATGMEVVTNIPDYYALLELDKSATQQEIGNAYRYFVKRCHPVMHKHKDAATRDRNARLFILYNEAYEVLGHTKSRAVYDFYGRLFDKKIKNLTKTRNAVNVINALSFCSSCFLFRRWKSGT